jgi:hypothetical protein
MRSARIIRLFRIFILIGGALGWILLSCYKGNGLSPLEQDSGGATTGIKGKIVFSGNWPDSTKEVRVAVLKNYPDHLTNSDSLMAFVLVNLVAFSDTLPRFVNACDYQFALPVGTYGWVLVAWFPDIPQYIFGVKELGAYYRIGGMQKTPSPVHVIPGVMMEGINISAELDNVKRPLPFFKAFKNKNPETL